MSESQSCFSKTKRVSYRIENRPIAFGTNSDLLVTHFGRTSGDRALRSAAKELQ